MKPTLQFAGSILSLLLLLCVGCSTQYVATMQSDGMHKRYPDSTFYSGGDTLGVSYSFNNHDGSIRIRLENYSDQSLMIDLEKSAVVINGETRGYLNGTSFVQGRITGDAITWANGNNRDRSRYTTMSGDFSASIQNERDRLFIPAQSFLEGTYINLAGEVKNLFKENFTGNKGQIFLFDQFYPTYTMQYGLNNSPLKIRSHISYEVLNKENQLTASASNVQTFYASELMQIRQASKNRLHSLLDTRADMSGTSVASKSGAVFGTIGILGGLVGLAVLLKDVPVDQN